MLKQSEVTAEQKMALECYLQRPAIIESLLCEGYAKEAEFRKNDILLEIENAEALEQYIEHAIILYTILLQPPEQHCTTTQLYISLRPEQWKTWMLQAEIPSFLIASTKPLELNGNDMQISIAMEQGVPHIALSAVLGEAYAHQILLSPFSQIEEKKVAKGNLQKEIVIRKPVLKSVSVKNIQELHKRVLQNFKAIKMIFDKIGKEPLSRQEILLYANWKRTLLSYVRARMKQATQI